MYPVRRCGKGHPFGASPENPAVFYKSLASAGLSDCQKTLGMRRRAAALRLKSAAGDMCGGEERKYSASYINLRPQK